MRHPVEHHLRHRLLPAVALARRLVIDRHRQALQRARLVDPAARLAEGLGCGARAVAFGKLDRFQRAFVFAQLRIVRRQARCVLEIVESGTGKAFPRRLERHGGEASLFVHLPHGAGEIPPFALRCKGRQCDRGCQQPAARRDLAALAPARLVAQRTRRGRAPGAPLIPRCWCPLAHVRSCSAPQQYSAPAPFLQVHGRGIPRRDAGLAPCLTDICLTKSVSCALQKPALSASASHGLACSRRPEEGRRCKPSAAPATVTGERSRHMPLGLASGKAAGKRRSGSQETCP